MQFLHRFRVVLVLTALMLAAQFMSFLPPVTDMVDPTAAPPDLSIPIIYLIFAPLSNVLDFLTFLTVGRAVGLIVGGLALLLGLRYLRDRKKPWIVGREVKVAVKALVWLLVLGVVAALLPRPVPQVVAPAGELVVDYHTHTSASHDGYFGVGWADGWHRRQGFDVWFLTEHNKAPIGAAREPAPAAPPTKTRRAARPTPPPAATAASQAGPLPGIEVSVYRLHIVGLGSGDTISRAPFVTDARSALGVFSVLHAQNRVTILSLPEYWRNYWETLDAVVTAGADGLEIVNCAPKALTFTKVWRESVIETARWNRRLVVGASDNHGIGQATCVWNLVAASRDSLLPLLRERRNGVSTNRVIARTLAVAEYPTWLTIIAGPWTIWRTASFPEAGVWLLWMWVIAIRRPYRPPPPPPAGPRVIRPGGPVKR